MDNMLRPPPYKLSKRIIDVIETQSTNVGVLFFKT